MTDHDPISDFLERQGPPVMRQTERQTKPVKAPAKKRGGRPRKARGAATSADKAATRWTVRGVPLNVREIATKAAENRGMTVGDWISEAVVAFSKADTNKVSADSTNVPAPADLVNVMKDVQARLTILETRDTRGLLGKLFGKSTMAALVIAVLLIGGTAWANKDTYRSFGAGTESCGRWTMVKEARSQANVVFKQWINGYLTAYNGWVEFGSGNVEKTQPEGAWAWIDNYCQDNPLNDVAWAAAKLIDAIKAK